MKKEKKAVKHGWGNGRFARSLTYAREQSARKIGRANLAMLENRGIVVVHRKMLEDLMRTLRAIDDANLSRRAASANLRTTLETWA